MLKSTRGLPMINKEKCFDKNIHINYSDMDYNLVLKPSALLNFLQDLASDNAEQLGFGYSTTYPKNLGWFCLSIE